MGQDDDDDPWNDEIDERTENDRLWKVWSQAQFLLASARQKPVRQRHV